MFEISAQVAQDMQKHVGQVQKKCKERAGRGHNSAKSYVFDFFGELEDFRSELDMMGLTVRELRLDGDKAICFEVEWMKKRGSMHKNYGYSRVVGLGRLSRVKMVKAYHTHARA